MIIVCQKCSSRLQVDKTKLPTGTFNIRCPKCSNSVEISAPSPASEQSAIALGDSPSTGNPRFERPNPAPLFEAEHNEAKPERTAADALLEMLAKLGGNSPAPYDPQAGRPAWNPRKALVCAPEENRDAIARGFISAGYKVFVANDTRQAIERMREDQLDLVILDSRFDPVEQGQVFVTREISILRPAQRRRVFFVLLSPSLRTMDAHSAFLNNANAVVNLNEVGELTQLIDHRLREYNELYKDFNVANGVPAL